MHQEMTDEHVRLARAVADLEKRVAHQGELIEQYRLELERLKKGGEDKYAITTSKQKVDAALRVLDKMYHYNGGYSASPHGAYKAFWLRDIMYCSIAKEYMGDFDSVKKTYGLMLDIFDKYSHKIDSCIDNRPTEKHDFLHARYRVHTLEEFPDEWGHNQLDIFGLFLYKVGNLKLKGIEVLRNLRDVKRVQDIVWYLYSIRWYEAPDYGVWEEGPELHSSSIGSVLAGLMSVRENIEEVRVPARFIRLGKEALGGVLSRESESRPYDLAQLSLIWPYKVVDTRMRDEVLDNVEGKLTKDNGVIRYPGDHYYNPEPFRPHGNEPQWPMGFSWLSIVYTKIAEESLAAGDEREAARLLKKAHHYVIRTEKTMVDGNIPELYTSAGPNVNTPLSWAHAMYVIAVQAIENLKAKMEKGDFEAY